MQPDPDLALDTLTLVISEVRDDTKLQAWFRELPTLPENVRREAIVRAVRKMRVRPAAGQTAVAFEVLAQPQVFAVIQAALRECGVQV